MPNVPASPTHESLQVVIVGGGPIGIELSVALQRRGTSHVVLEAGAIGQTMTWWAPGTRWFSSNERIAIAGVPLLNADQTKATREQYLTYLRSIVSQYALPIRTYCPVTGVRGSRSSGFEVLTSPAAGEQGLRCGAVVLAIGGTDFPRPLDIPGAELPHVDGYLRDPHRYFGRRVLIIGGRNSAVEAALRLHHAGAHVSLSYRQPELPKESIKYWLWPEIDGLCRTGRIEAYFATTPIEITPGSVRLRNAAGATLEVAADEVLSLIGYEQDKRLFRAAGVELTGETERPVYNEATMQTNVPGIYVAGTATAGSQNSRYKTFLENCHEHIDRIVTDLTGQATDTAPQPYQRQIAAQPES